MGWDDTGSLQGDVLSIVCVCLQEPESVFPVDEKPYMIVVTFTKETPDEPVTADISLLGCFKPCEFYIESNLESRYQAIWSSKMLPNMVLQS